MSCVMLGFIIWFYDELIGCGYFFNIYNSIRYIFESVNNLILVY